MWNGEWNPQLAKIPEIREIDAHLRDMSFRRKLLGCDPDDVRECVAELTRRYKGVIASLLTEQGQEWQTQGLRERLAQLEQENARLNSAFQEWVQWYAQANAALQAENGQLRGLAAGWGAWG